MNTINPLQSIRYTGSIGSQSKGQPQLSIEPQTGQLLKALVLEIQDNNRALLQIGDTQISARTEIPLKPGQPLQLQVASTSPEVQLKIVGETLNHFLGKSITLIGKPIDITFLFRSLQQPQQQPVQQQTSTPAQISPSTVLQNSQQVPAAATQQNETVNISVLKDNQFRTTIVESQGNNRFILQAGSEKLTITSPAPLKIGEPLDLKIIETGPLRVQITGPDPVAPLNGTILTIPETPPNITALSSLFTKSSSIFEILSPQSRHTLENYFSAQNTLSAPSKEGGPVLKELVDRLGLSFERLLSQGENAKAASTLKAALLEILQTLKGAEHVAKSTNQLLTTIELFQLAQLQSDTGQQFIFPLPLPFVEQGYMLVDQNSGGEGENSSQDEQERRFSLHLKLSDLGNIRVDFFQTQEGLYVRFHTDSDDKSDFVKGFSDELRQSISDVPVLGLSFGTEAEDPANELLRHILPDGRNVLDTKV